jgi:transcriptional regulator with XRE-family HTH domain
MSVQKGRQSRAVAETRLTVLVESAARAAAISTALAENNALDQIEVVGECDAVRGDTDKLLVLSDASTLHRVAECVSAANKVHRLVALLVNNDVGSNWFPHFLHTAGIRILRNMVVFSDDELPVRVLNAWALGGEHDFIADATVVDDTLWVQSCAFERFSVSFDAFAALRSMPEEARADFRIEDDGLLLYWPKFRVHLDLDEIRFANDPERKREALARSLGSQRAIGAALRRLRENANLAQSDIPGMSERQVRRVETGDRLTVDTIDAFSAALSMDPDHLLERISQLVGDVENRPQSVEQRQGTLGVEGNYESASYPRERGSTKRHGRVGELTLAASSLEHLPEIRRRLEFKGGFMSGTIIHDLKTDTLLFLVEETKNLGAKALSIQAWSSRKTEPFVSATVTPSVGMRIHLASGQGVVPAEVTKVELREVDDQ